MDFVTCKLCPCTNHSSVCFCACHRDPVTDERYELLAVGWHVVCEDGIQRQPAFSSRAAARTWENECDLACTHKVFQVVLEDEDDDEEDDGDPGLPPIEFDSPLAESLRRATAAYPAFRIAGIPQSDYMPAADEPF